MSASKFTCVLFGDESLLIQCAETLLSRGHLVSGVVTASPFVKNWAERLGLTIHVPGSDLALRLSEVEFDWLFSIGNRRVIPRQVWAQARAGALNFHDGPLPTYAGLNVTSWAIMSGENQHGITWHQITDAVDGGAIAAERTFDILPDDTAFTLNARCFEAGLESFSEVLTRIEDGSIDYRPQATGAGSLFRKNKRPPGGAVAQFASSAFDLARCARALDFGLGFPNPLAVPKLKTERGLYAVGTISIVEDAPSAAPGVVLEVDENSVLVATPDGAVRLSKLTDMAGGQVEPSRLMAVGDRLPSFSEPELNHLTSVLERVATSEDFFVARLSDLRPLELSAISPAADEPARFESLSIPLSAALSPSDRLAALMGSLSRISGQEVFDIAYSGEAARSLALAAPEYISPTVPFRIDVKDQWTLDSFRRPFVEQVDDLERRGSFSTDLILRRPELRPTRLDVGIRVGDGDSDASAIEACAVTFVVGDAIHMIFDERRLSNVTAQKLVRMIEVAVSALAANAHASFRDLPLMSAEDTARILHEWNSTERPFERSACLHHFIEAQVDRCPQAIALASRDRSMTYGELEAAANRLANALLRRGVGPDVLVGLHARRSFDLVIGALAIHKAGGAYVPLDPSYPAERLELMIEDARPKIILTHEDLSTALDGAPGILCFDDASVARESASRPSSPVKPDNLAYVIFTSGSTGRPKGVMIEHRNVANFIAGMDERIPVATATQPVWLAVTSLSFDISVLELFWTLARGFKVVIAPDSSHKVSSASAHSSRPIDFGLFFWGNDDGPGPEKYRLLLEAAKFADAHGFSAVWTPERHFHAFGGPYPNPAVTGAAVAAVTSNVQIRAGSCVLPLHHPARVAEEWAVVDNLSGGRVGVSFASGWMPEDFVLRPENAPPGNKASMLRDIEVVRRLWRGEAVEFPFQSDRSVRVTTLPRPVQEEIPVWVTTAGNPETYREAADLKAQRAHPPAGSVDRRRRRQDPNLSGQARRQREQPQGRQSYPHASHAHRRGPRNGSLARTRAHEALLAQRGGSHQAICLGLSSLQKAAGRLKAHGHRSPGLAAGRDGRDSRLRVRALLRGQRAVRHDR